MQVYEIRLRSDKRGLNLRCAPIRSLVYGERNAIINAIDYGKFRSRSYDAVIRFTTKQAT